MLALLGAPCFAVQFERFVADDAALDDNLGRAVAIHGDTAALGARHAANPETGSGAVYLITRGADGVWSEPSELVPVDADKGEHFGDSVGLQRDTLFVGAPLDDSETELFNGKQAGSVYVFERDASGAWTQKQKLRAPNQVTVKQFGSALAVHDDLLVVGARWSAGGALAQLAVGTAYVFRKIGEEWVVEAKLDAEDAAGLDQFGTTVAVHDGIVVVGALGHDHFPMSVNIGAAYVFRATEIVGVWAQEAELIASDHQFGDHFGHDVAVSHGRILSGAPSGNSPEAECGAAYLFEFEDGVWVEREKLLPNDGQTDDEFGTSVALSATRALVGADREDAKEPNGGAAYLFIEEHGGFTRQLKFAPDDLTQADWFGHSVAFGDDVVLLGAPRVDVSADATAAGAAYVLPLGQLLPWTDLAQGLAGSDGVPVLTGLGPHAVGAPLELRLDDGRPGAPAFAVVGLAELSRPLKGGVLVPSPDLLIAGELDAEGHLSLAFTPPALLVSGVELRFQIWILDDAGPRDFSASNALLAKLP